MITGGRLLRVYSSGFQPGGDLSYQGGNAIGTTFRQTLCGPSEAGQYPGRRAGE